MEHYLCPNDLTLGRTSTHAPQGPFKERVTNKHIPDVFPGLLIRPKRPAENRNVQKGDVVFVQDSNDEGEGSPPRVFRDF